MSARTKFAITVATIAGLSFTVPAVSAQEANPTITITPEETAQGYNYRFSPTQLDAKVGQNITVTNNDSYGVHSVTEKGRSFSVDVPPNSSKTLTVSKAGNYQYLCDWHTDNHTPKYASLNVS